jgi:drug/metabolite transporter (DMT)-like permease
VKQGRGPVLTALAVGGIAIGFAAIFFRLASPTDPLLASALRLGIAGLVLSPIAVRAVQSGALTPRATKTAVLAGLLYAVHFGAWVASLDRTTVAASVTIVTATPLLLAAVALVRGRDRPSRRVWIACVVAAIGAGVIGFGDATEAGLGALAGDLLALLGAVAMAVYLLVVRGVGKVPAFAFSGIAALSGAATLAVALAVEAPFVAITAPDEGAFFFIVLAALIPQIVGHGALTWALERATPTEVGLATAVEPVISTVLAWWLFAERPSTLVSAGAGLTLVAVVAGVAGKTGESRSSR